MNSDLEMTLAELGPEYRAVAARVVDAYAPCAAFRPAAEPAARPRAIGWGFWLLAAASLAAALALSVVLRRTPSAGGASAPAAYVLAYGGGAESCEELVRTQRADGSWANDYLTRQNAAALRGSAAGTSGEIAYRKALRYLRSRGLLPFTEKEMSVRGGQASRFRQA